MLSRFKVKPVTGARQYDALQRRADEDLAHRSRASGLVYLVLYGVILAFSHYARDYPVLALAIGLVLITAASARTWLTGRFNTLYNANPSRWRRSFGALTLLLAVTWGGFCAHTVLNYKLEWTSMLTLLATAGISAAAITTLSIHQRLILVFLALLLLPPIAASALLESRESIAITLLFLTYSIFLFAIARRTNSAYWEALHNTLLLDRRARELEASNQELESYSYSIAHDLRSPLRAIIGFSQILRDELRERISPSEQQDFDRVVRAGKHMAQLIDDILELSRITRKTFASVDTDLSALVSAHAETLADNEPERDVTWRIQPDLHTLGDPRLLDLALQNLLDNAWKFTARSPHAEIEFRAADNGGKTVYCLCDNGVGFDMTYARKLFRPFERLHTETEFPGTGIGLATVHRIILRHGGHIWAEGEPDGGACFYFTL